MNLCRMWAQFVHDPYLKQPHPLGIPSGSGLLQSLSVMFRSWDSCCHACLNLSRFALGLFYTNTALALAVALHCRSQKKLIVTRKQDNASKSVIFFQSTACQTQDQAPGECLQLLPLAQWLTPKLQLLVLAVVAEVEVVEASQFPILIWKQLLSSLTKINTEVRLWIPWY